MGGDPPPDLLEESEDQTLSPELPGSSRLSWVTTPGTLLLPMLRKYVPNRWKHAYSCYLTITEIKGGANTANYFNMLLLGTRKAKCVWRVICFFSQNSLFQKRVLRINCSYFKRRREREIHCRKNGYLFAQLLTFYLRNVQAYTKPESSGEPPCILCSTSTIIRVCQSWCQRVVKIQFNPRSLCLHLALHDQIYYVMKDNFHSFPDLNS